MLLVLYGGRAPPDGDVRRNWLSSAQAAAQDNEDGCSAELRAGGRAHPPPPPTSCLKQKLLLLHHPTEAVKSR